jgi:hypothetical protein
MMMLMKIVVGRQMAQGGLRGSVIFILSMF